MRFAAVTRPQQLPARAPAADVMRRIVTRELRQPAQPADQRHLEVPAELVDLDQRVRLAGEW